MKKLISVILASLMICAALVFAAPAYAKSIFVDVPSTRWSYDSVSYAYVNGYMLGVDTGKFDPEGTLTRAMAVTVLWRREGSPAPKNASGFSDVDSDAWYSRAVAWAREAGVVYGVSETAFDPVGAVTREALAAMIFRYCQLFVCPDGQRGDVSSFSDAASIGGWAVESLEWAVGAKLFIGSEDGTLDPGGQTSREQFAAVIERFDKYAKTGIEPSLKADFYVSTAGDDSGDGSFANPFRTLGRAVLAVRETPKTADRGGITVAVSRGEYVLFDFDLTPADSGSKDCPVTYTALGNGPVTVTNGFDIPASSFVPLEDGEKGYFKSTLTDKIMRTDVAGLMPYGAKVSDYYVYGDELLDPARTPNREYAEGSALWTAAATVAGAAEIRVTDSILSRKLAKYHTFDGVMLYGTLAYEAIFDTASVASYDADTKTFTLSDPTELSSYPWAGGLFSDPDEPRFSDREDIDLAILNVSEELDVAGEFYADPACGSMYFYEPSGDYRVVPSDAVLQNGAAENVTFAGMEFEEYGWKYEPEIPVVYLDKEPGRDFKVLNISDPQLNDSEWEGSGGQILTDIVHTLVEEEQPDLITVSGDLAWGGQFASIAELCCLLDETGIPWAPVFGNHDHQDLDVYVDLTVAILEDRDNCLFRRGDRSLGVGNYVIIIRESGEPLHALIMMDTHGKDYYIDEDGYEHSMYSRLTQKQIAWYETVVLMLKEQGVKESTLIYHIPDYTYNDALEAALLPGVDPYTMDPSEGMQTGCWAEGYEDSFGAVLEPISSPPEPSGIFDKMLELGHTKTVLCGHDHTNSFSTVYRGVRFAYSLKTGPGCNWDPRATGGTVIEIGADGSAALRHKYVAY